MLPCQVVAKQFRNFPEIKGLRMVKKNQNTLSIDLPCNYHLKSYNTIQQRNRLPKCTEFSSHKFLCADDIIYVVSDDVKFRFQFAVQNMLDVIL